MIILKESQAFAHGNHREVYKHPDNPKRCLKLMTEHWKDSPRWQRANILGKIFRPHTYFNENESEYQFSKATKKKIGTHAADFIAIAHGYVESDRGQVLEVDLIADDNGETSLSLKEFIWRYGLTEPCETAIEKFWTQLHEHWVFVQARPDNLSIKELDDGSLQIFAIDGYAYTQFIPLAKWFLKEKNRKLAKFKRNQQLQIDHILAARESGNDHELGSQGILQRAGNDDA